MKKLLMLLSITSISCYAAPNGSFHSSQEIADFQSINVPPGFASGVVEAEEGTTTNGDTMIGKLYPGDGFSNERHPGNGSFHSSQEIVDFQSINVPPGFASGVVEADNAKDNGDGMVSKLYSGF